MADRAILDDAAAAALWLIGPQPHEHVGVLYQQGDPIVASPTRSTRDRGKAGGRFSIPSGSLRALFHNHPPVSTAGRSRTFTGATGRGDERAAFSVADSLNADRLRVPSYISAGDRIFRYDPHTGQTKEVLAQIPIDVILANVALRNPLARAYLTQQDRPMPQPIPAPAPQPRPSDNRASARRSDRQSAR